MVNNSTQVQGSTVNTTDPFQCSPNFIFESVRQIFSNTIPYRAALTQLTRKLNAQISQNESPEQMTAFLNAIKANEQNWVYIYGGAPGDQALIHCPRSNMFDALNALLPEGEKMDASLRPNEFPIPEGLPAQLDALYYKKPVDREKLGADLAVIDPHLVMTLPIATFLTMCGEFELLDILFQNGLDSKIVRDMFFNGTPNSRIKIEPFYALKNWKGSLERLHPENQRLITDLRTHFKV